MRPLSATVDGKSVDLQGPATVLDACRAAGADVVALCDHPSLAAAPTCNTCQVIVNGMLVRACAEPLRSGAAINTIGSAAKVARRAALAKASAGHPIACSTCPQTGDCELQDGLAANAPVPIPGVQAAKLLPSTKSPALGPLLSLHLELCVGCTRCTRFAADVLHRPLLSLVSTPQRPAVLHVDESSPLGVPYALAFAELCPVGVFQHDKPTRRALPLWTQNPVASVCSGCATGCNVWLHEREGHVARVSCRGGAHFLCDDGYTLFDVAPAPRLAVPLTAGVVASWDLALDAAAALLASALKDGTLAVVFSAQSPTLDLAALSMFAFERAAVAHAYAYFSPAGPATPPLMNADKNPNTSAVVALAPKAKPLAQLVDAIESGSVSAVFFLGVATQLTDDSPLVAALRSLPALVVASAYDDQLARLAKVSLPLAPYEETSGSFVNGAGLPSAFAPIVPTPSGDALPGWDITNLLARRLGIDLGLESMQDVRAWLAREHPRLCPTQGGA